MTQVLRFQPLLTGLHRYDKSLSTRGRGHGVIIQAPILAYLIETRNGRILYDVGCDYRKLSDPILRQHYYQDFAFGPPDMSPEQCLPQRLAQLGLSAADVDVICLSHLHFDHAGGLHEFAHAEVHVQREELSAAREPADTAYFADDFNGDYRWRVHTGEYSLIEWVEVISSPGHTAGHTSLLIELPQGTPILLCGDAADLCENLRDEVAPGLCWQEREDLALRSIRKLKRIAAEQHAQLWPNHDLDFYHTHHHAYLR
jgi:N-acyl homoserine lactone hydrolase